MHLIDHDAVKGFVKIKKKVSHGTETRGKKQKITYNKRSTIQDFDVITYTNSLTMLVEMYDSSYI